MNSKSEPLVSIVIPVKNSEKYLNEALNSATKQNYKAIEVIVVDGNSTDNSLEITKNFNSVTVIPQDGTGLANAWNCGIRHASGEYVSLLDSDDRYVEDKISSQVMALQNNPDSYIIDGRVIFFKHDDDKIPSGFRKNLFNGDHQGNMPGTWLIKRQLLNLIGYFDESYKVTPDIDWLNRVNDNHYNVLKQNKVVLNKRIHVNNLSLGTLSGTIYNKELLELVRHSVLRKRKSIEN